MLLAKRVYVGRNNMNNVSIGLKKFIGQPSNPNPISLVQRGQKADGASLTFMLLL